MPSDACQNSPRPSNRPRSVRARLPPLALPPSRPCPCTLYARAVISRIPSEDRLERGNFTRHAPSVSSLQPGALVRFLRPPEIHARVIRVTSRLICAPNLPRLSFCRSADPFLTSLRGTRRSKPPIEPPISTRILSGVSFATLPSRKFTLYYWQH